MSSFRLSGFDRYMISCTHQDLDSVLCMEDGIKDKKIVFYTQHVEGSYTYDGTIMIISVSSDSIDITFDHIMLEVTMNIKYTKCGDRIKVVTDSTYVYTEDGYYTPPVNPSNYNSKTAEFMTLAKFLSFFSRDEREFISALFNKIGKGYVYEYLKSETYLEEEKKEV